MSAFDLAGSSLFLICYDSHSLPKKSLKGKRHRITLCALHIEKTVMAGSKEKRSSIKKKNWDSRCDRSGGRKKSMIMIDAASLEA